MQLQDSDHYFSYLEQIDIESIRNWIYYIEDLINNIDFRDAV